MIQKGQSWWKEKEEARRVFLHRERDLQGKEDDDLSGEDDVAGSDPELEVVSEEGDKGVASPEEEEEEEDRGGDNEEEEEEDDDDEDDDDEDEEEREGGEEEERAVPSRRGVV